MPTASPGLAARFSDIVTAIGAAFREQREIDARRVLRRYRHLLGQPDEKSCLNEMSPVSARRGYF